MPAHQPTVHPPSPTHRRRCRPAGRSAAPAAPRSYRCAEAGRPQTCTRRCDAPRAAGEGARWRCHVVRRPAMGTAADGRQARSWQCPWQAKQGRLRLWQRQGMSSSCDCTRPGTSLQCAQLPPPAVHTRGLQQCSQAQTASTSHLNADLLQRLTQEGARHRQPPAG